MTVSDFDDHLDHDHIAAVFADRPSAETAAEALRAHGLGSEYLGVAVHDDNPVNFEHDADTELEHDIEVGVVAGAPLGALAGLAVAALGATGVGVIGVGGILALSGAAAIWGAVVGGVAGAAVGSTSWDEHQDLSYTALEPGEVLVVVCSHGQPDAVRTTMHDAGGRIVSPDATSY